MTILPHQRNIPFGTRHLILTGLLDDDELRDDLLNGVLKVEVIAEAVLLDSWKSFVLTDMLVVSQIHDRDYRLPDDLKRVAEGIGDLDDVQVWRFQNVLTTWL